MTVTKIPLKEFGLDIGSILSSYFFQTEDLHYGFWQKGLEVKPQNIAAAQAAFSEFLISQIPIGVETILDVGCGSGNLATKLVARGYKVDCVSPSPFLTEKARQKLPASTTFYECYFEDIQCQKTYDLVLFSESFQYVKVERSLQRAFDLLNPKSGHLLICDFFSRDVEGKSPISGGHKWSKFQREMEKSFFETVKEQDITDKTSPSIDILDDMLVRVGAPFFSYFLAYLSGNYPLFHKVLRWKYRKKIAKMENKFLSKSITKESFEKFKVYKFLLYKMKPGQ